MRILVIGEGNRDMFHYGECCRLCPDAPVPVFKSVKINQNGGMARNVEANLSSLGATADIVSNNNWEDITKTRFVDMRSNHMFLRVDENDENFGVLKITELDNINFSLYDAVIVSDYDKGYLSEELLYKISSMHSLTFLDTKKILGDWASLFTYIKVNSKEYDRTKHTVTKELKKKMIITRGPRGSEFRGYMSPVPPVEVRDTSGAGDTFIAALCYYFVKTGNIGESINFANECATSAVQKQGVSVV